MSSFVIVSLLPKKIDKPSYLMCSFLVLFIYIPFSIIIFRTNEQWVNFEEGFILWCFVFVGVFLVTLSLHVRRINVAFPRKIKSTYVIYLTAIITVYYIVLTASNFTLVGIDKLTELNDVRSSSKVTGFSAYVYLWLISILLPYSIGVLFFNKKILFGMLFAFVYVYFSFSMGAKILLVAPITFFGLFIWFKKFNSDLRCLFWGVSCFIVFLYVFGIFSPETSYFMKALFFFRTISIPSLAFSIYYDYFNTNHLTYFTHIGIVADIFATKSQIALPVALHNWYGLGNFNANFLVNDGYASLGHVGIIIMAMVYALLIYILDICSCKKDSTVCLFSLVYIIMFQANISLFTLMVSHGLFMLPLLYLFVNDDF
ncbi:TPA: hypothetical protein ACSPZU_002994 [Aeromonas veronii]